jgi:hypothetical protein
MGMFADTVLGAVSGAGWKEAIICSTLSIHVLYRHNETQRDFKNRNYMCWAEIGAGANLSLSTRLFEILYFGYCNLKEFKNL